MVVTSVVWADYFSNQVLELRLITSRCKLLLRHLIVLTVRLLEVFDHLIRVRL